MNMTILTHGSDLTLAPTLRPVVAAYGGTVQAAADALQQAKFHAVQLDGTLPGIRARDLDQRARKDLIGVFARRSLQIAGLDLFVPSRHFADPANMDRAMEATLAGIQLAADLGRLTVSIALPVKQMTDEQKTVLAQAADGHGIGLAIHAEDQIDELLAWIKEVDMPALGAAVDPATVLGRSGDPSKLVGRLGKVLKVARLNDLSVQDGSGGSSDDGSGMGVGLRSIVGAGDLDVVGYRIAVDLASKRTGPVVLDLRGMERPMDAAAEAARQWDKAAFTA